MPWAMMSASASTPPTMTSTHNTTHYNTQPWMVAKTVQKHLQGLPWGLKPTGQKGRSFADMAKAPIHDSQHTIPKAFINVAMEVVEKPSGLLCQCETRSKIPPWAWHQ